MLTITPRVAPMCKEHNQQRVHLETLHNLVLRHAVCKIMYTCICAPKQHADIINAPNVETVVLK